MYKVQKQSDMFSGLWLAVLLKLMKMYSHVPSLLDGYSVNGVERLHKLHRPPTCSRYELLKPINVQFLPTITKKYQ